MNIPVDHDYSTNVAFSPNSECVAFVDRYRDAVTLVNGNFALVAGPWMVEA